MSITLVSAPIDKDEAADDAARSLATFVLFVLFVGATVILQVVQRSRDPAELTGEGDMLRQLFYLAAFLLALVAADAMRKPARLLSVPASVLLVLGWCWLSITWAIEPGIGVRRLMLTTVITLTIFISVHHAGTKNALHAVRAALVVCLIANYFAVFLTSHGVHFAGETADAALVGNWRGVLIHKNFAGPVCAFTVIFFLLGPNRMSLLARAIVVCAAAWFLLQSQSKTSIALLGIAVAVGYLSQVAGPAGRKILLAAVVIVAVVGSQFASTVLAPFIEAASRPGGLTGRAEIWPILADYAQKHLLTGSGYGSFWNIGPASPVYAYTDGWIARLATGHNGYLDLAAQVGAPGLVLTVLGVIAIPVLRALTDSRVPGPVVGVAMACIAFAAGHNVTESTMMERDSLVWLFLLLSLAVLHSSISEHQSREHLAGADA